MPEALGMTWEQAYLAASNSDVVGERQRCPFFIKCIYKHTEHETFFSFFTVMDDYMSMKCFHLFGARVIKIS